MLEFVISFFNIRYRRLNNLAILAKLFAICKKVFLFNYQDSDSTQSKYKQPFFPRLLYKQAYV